MNHTRVPCSTALRSRRGEAFRVEGYSALDGLHSNVSINWRGVLVVRPAASIVYSESTNDSEVIAKRSAETSQAEECFLTRRERQLMRGGNELSAHAGRACRNASNLHSKPKRQGPLGSSGPAPTFFGFRRRDGAGVEWRRNPLRYHGRRDCC